jgi:spore germination protein KC
MKRRLAALLAALTLAAGAQGCWNYREIDSMLIVAGVAIDRGYEGHKYHLTMDLADTSNAGKDKPVVTTLVEAEGDTIFDALRNAVKTTGLRLYWANCQIIVVGSEVAEESIVPIVDFFLRDAELRLTIELFIARDGSAKDILKSSSTSMTITSFEIDRMYELNEKYQPVALYQQLYENFNTLADSGRELTVAALRLTDNMGGTAPTLDGMAVFRQDRLAGFLSAEDTAYYLFVMDRVKGAALTVRASTGNSIVALEVFGNKTTVTPESQGGNLRFLIHTETEAAIDGMEETSNIVQKDELMKLEEAAETQLRDSIARVVDIAQRQYGLDIFGFGEVLHRRDLQAWRRVEGNWNEVFRSARIDVECNIAIRDSAVARKPVQKGDGE